MENTSSIIEHDFHVAFNANKRKNIEVAVASVAHFRGLEIDEVRQMLKNIIKNIEDGNTTMI